MALRAAISSCETMPPMMRASLKRMRPRGLSTRKSSRSRAWRPGMWQSTSLEKTRSKVDSGNGKRFDASQFRSARVRINFAPLPVGRRCRCRERLCRCRGRGSLFSPRCELRTGPSRSQFREHKKCWAISSKRIISADSSLVTQLVCRDRGRRSRHEFPGTPRRRSCRTRCCTDRLSWP